MLADIHGHPLIWHVWQRVCQAQSIERVLIATDADQIQAAAQAFGAEVVLTSPNCRSGTERIASILEQLDADLILNVQGDEPLIDPVMLDQLVSRWQAAPCDLITPVYKIASLQDLENPNIVKVVRAADGRALYFSRSPIPYLRDTPRQAWLDTAAFWGHIGVYGYHRPVLAGFGSLPNSPLEEMEKLEQLRFLEAGYTFQTVETDYHPIAIDTPADLERVRQMLG
jgi:3-deoxy-manno-octulosonate cytidylyltransferase (CMP-KDO synthetase)